MTKETDKELLELAAKAAGFLIVSWDEDGVPKISFDQIRRWNPLSSLAQAKTLRHRCLITTGFDDRFLELGLCAYATYPLGENGCNSVMQPIVDSDSKLAATRRAIVRAAAEIGRAMP